MQTLKISKIKEVIRTRYAFPGGYELFLIASDGATICTTCARENFRCIVDSTKNEIADGWAIVAYDAECNIDGPLNCEHCNKVIVEGNEEE